MRRSVVLLLAIACSDPPPAPPPPAPPADAAPPAPPPRPVEPKTRVRDPAVFVDGVPYGVMAFGELPPELDSIFLEEEDGRKLRRFELYAYLEALGVPMKRATDVHIHGPRRVAMLKGKDLRRWRSRVLFSFTQSSTGKPRIHWQQNVPIPGRTTVDLVKAIAVYVDKKAPVKNPVLRRLEVDGEPIEDGVAYQVADVRKSVRVYLDGRMIGAIKRKELGEKFLVPGSDVTGEPRWTLVPYLESLGVRWTEVRTVDLIHDDAVAKRIPAKDLESAEFSAALDQGGQILVRPSETKVSALLLYVRSTPPGPR